MPFCEFCSFNVVLFLQDLSTRESDYALEQIQQIFRGFGHSQASCLSPASTVFTAGNDANHFRKSSGKINVRRPHLTARRSPARMAIITDVLPSRAFSQTSETL
jgi:hypothetical protein